MHYSTSSMVIVLLYEATRSMILHWEHQVTGPGYTGRVGISGHIALQSDVREQSGAHPSL